MEPGAARNDVISPLSFLRKLVFALLLFLLVFIVFGNTLRNGFAFDDTSMVRDNPAIRNARYVKSYFTKPFFLVGRPTIGPIEYDYYRPLVLVSCLADYQLYKTSPSGYHLTNILLHSGAVILLFLVLGRLGMQAPLAFLGAALFAVHPAVADSVASVSGRSDPLCALFLLCAFYIYTAARQKDGDLGRWVLPAYQFFFVLALLAKENAIVFPVLISAYELIERRKNSASLLTQRLGVVVPAYGVALVYLFVRRHFVPAPLAFHGNGIKLGFRVATAAGAVGNYLLKVLLPFNLHLETFTPLAHSFLSLSVILSFASLAGLIVVIAVSARQSARVAFFLVWALLFFLPFSYFVLFQSGPLFYTPPHFLYFPLMGLTAAAALLVGKVLGIMSGRIRSGLAFASLALVLLAFSVQTVRRNTDWTDEFTFFSRMARYSPQSARDCIGMGNAFLARGDAGYALAQFARAYHLAIAVPSEKIQLPDAGKEKVEGTIQVTDFYAATARAGMGDAYLLLDETPNAIENYEAAVRENAFDFAIQLRLARAYEASGNLDEAVSSYDRALRLNGKSLSAASGRQVALLKKEVYDQAKRVYLTSHLSKQENSADAFYGEAIMLRLSGKRAGAEALLRMAVEEDPLHFGANLALGQMLSEEGTPEEALGYLGAAFASNPSSAIAAKELSLTSLVLKDTVSAQQWAAKAYELSPDEHYERFLNQIDHLTGRH